jgi:protein-L-isoaspartate(D-aspartate) O-methyltransferase
MTPAKAAIVLPRHLPRKRIAEADPAGAGSPWQADALSARRLARKGFPVSPDDSSVIPKKLRLLMELRRAGIGDARVLGAIEKTPREIFIPPAFVDSAYENVALPIGQGQTVSQPYIVALMTEKLELGDLHNVLEIGTGSGYQAAVLARLARRVFTIERHRALLREAERRFAELKLHNIVARVGDGAKGWREQAPFDRIVVTAAAREVPAALREALAAGGILIVPIGRGRRDQRLVRIRRVEEEFLTEDLGAAHFVPLVDGVPRQGAQH